MLLINYMRKLIFKILYFINFYKLLLIFNKKKITTLMFHRISPDFDRLWPSLDPENFEKFIQILSNNFKIISLEQIENIRNLRSNYFIVTFDDGYNDFLKYALPILNKYKVKANLNICPNLINKKTLPWTQKINILLSENNFELYKLLDEYNINFDKKILINESIFNKICSNIHRLDNNNYNAFIKKVNLINFEYDNILLNWQELEECKKRNIVIGNHSFNHLNLNKLDEKILNYEIFESKIEIEKKLKIKVDVFSIPNGMINLSALNKLKKIYKFLLFSDDDRNMLIIQNQNYLLNRINISLNDPYEEFFRAIGFHNKLKKIILFFFKKNNKT